MSIGGADFQVSGRIQIDLVARGLDAATRSLAGITAASEKAAASLRKVGDGFAAIGQKSRAAGTMMTAGITAPILGIGALAIGAASDLGEARSAVSTVFGSASTDVLAFAKNADTALGISEEAALSAATQLGALFGGVGIGQRQAAGFSQDIVTASADLASFYNVAGGGEQVMQDIRSGLIGEAEPLRKYGILLSEAAVQEELARQGREKLTGAELEAAKVEARYAIIMRSLGAAQGDFARTSGGAANQTRILRAELTNAAAEVGTILLPVVLKAVRGLRTLIGVFTALPASMKTTILIVAGIAAVIGPALIALGVFASGLGVVASVIGFLLSPIGLLLGAIAVLAFVFRGPLGTAVGAVVEAFKPLAYAFRAAFVAGTGIGNLVEFLPEPLAALERPILLIADALGDLWRAFQNRGIKGFWDQLTIGGEANQIKDGLGGIVDAFLGLAATIPWGRIAASLGMALVGVLGALVPPALDAIADLVTQMAGALVDVGAGLFDSLVDLADDIPWSEMGGALVDGLGIALDYLVANVPDAARAALRFGDDLLQTIEGLDWTRVGQIIGTGLGRAAGIGMRLVGSVLEDPGPFLKVLGALFIAMPLILARIYLAVFRIGRDILIGIIQGLYGELPTLWAAFRALGPAIVTAFGMAKDWLTGPGRDLLGGLLAGAIAKLPEVLAWLGGLLAAILPYVDDAAIWLFTAGHDLLAGFLAGAVDAAQSLWTWLSGLPGVIAGYAGQAFNWLFNAGYNLMSGLASGIYSGFRDLVVGALGWVTEQIPEWKGPRAKDLTLLYDSGRVVMEGFERGLSAGFVDVERSLGAMTRDLVPAVISPPAPRLAPLSAGARTVQAGGVTINVNGALQPRAVAEEVYRSLDAAFHRLELEVRR